MIARFLMIASLALLVGCANWPGGFGGAAGDADASPPAPTQTEAEKTPGDGDPLELEPLEQMETPQPRPEPAAEQSPEAAAPEPQPEPRPVDRNAAARAQCEDQNGSFSPTPRSGAFVCVKRTTDSNKSCSASSQCQGVCLARSGSCSPLTPLLGCHDIVTENGGMATVCVD